MQQETSAAFGFVGGIGVGILLATIRGKLKHPKQSTQAGDPPKPYRCNVHEREQLRGSPHGTR